ncbi:MAG: sirohydrochlorin chelatase [Caldilineaceae bacterium]|nr:sirohydrochlorin chelatase [Caldilineaceae bacterium]
MDALLLLGPAGQSPATEEAYQTLVAPVADRLGLAPAACALAFRETAALTSVRTFIAAGHRRIVVFPLALEAEEHQHEAIYGSLDWIRAQTPQVTIRYAPILAMTPPLLAALADRVAAVFSSSKQAERAERAILLIGRGGANAENNAEIARIARLLWEGRSYGWVESAYYQQSKPGVIEGLQRCARLGAPRIVVAPYWLYLGSSQRLLTAQVAAFQEQQPTISVTVAETLANHPGVIEAIAQQAIQAAADQPMPLPRTTHGHRHRHDRHGSESPMSPAATPLLPPRYRQGANVSAAPMGAAPLVYDAAGQVAWDRVWGKDDPDSPFCELALAGGPPHRGELLEPVTPEAVKADWAGYGRVLGELTRGIQLTTGLRTRLSQALGWIGVECDSEAMALWLLRAIVVENVSVRREGVVLYLPAGPAFRLDHEIKNVITALAKTHHYWQEHQLG